MVRHIVMWNLKDENKEENARAIKEALEGLNGRIEGLLSLEVMRGYQGCDLCLNATYADRAALTFYREHPLHKACQKLVHAAMRERFSCDYEY